MKTCCRHILGGLAWALAAVAPAAAQGEITAVMTVLPADGERYAAVEILSGESAMSAMTWFNNDELASFSRVLLLEAEGGKVPDLTDTGMVLAEVQGPTLAVGELELTEPVTSSTGRIFAVFAYPDGSDLSAKGYGGGPGVGIRESAGVSRTFLSHDGEEWIPLASSHEMAVDAILVSGKTQARTLASLAAESPGLVDLGKEIPIAATVLHAPFPNPFNPRTTIRFDLKDPGHVRIAIYTVQGRRVTLLEDGRLPSGRYERVWRGVDSDGGEVASGVYFVRMEAGGQHEVQRVALLR